MTSTPLLSYQLNPSPEPLMASPATGGFNQSVLTLTASNTTTSDVTLTYLRLDVPLGSGATDLLDLLTLAELQAAVAVTPDPAWTLFQTTVWTDTGQQLWASYLFHPEGNGTLPADNSWTFTWQGVAPDYWGVPINTVPGGPVACQVVEASATSPAGAAQPLPLSKAPAGWFAPTLVAAPVTVSNGGVVQLSWIGPAGASYQLNGLAGGAPDPLPNAGTFPSRPLTQDTVFTLQVNYTPAQGPPHKAAPQQTVTVAAQAPVINSFTGTMIWDGGPPQLLLSWDVEPVTATVTLSGSSKEFTASGSLPLTPTAAEPLLTTYTLTAVTTGNTPVTASLAASYESMATSTIAVGSFPAAIAFTPNGQQAWVTNMSGGTVTVLNPISHQPVPGSPVSVGAAPAPIAFAPDGSQVWIVNLGGTVTILNTATYQPVAASPVAVDGQPVAIGFTPNGGQAWVAEYSGNSVTVIDAATCHPVAASPVAVGMGPSGLAFTPDGSQAWVVNRLDGTVTVLDTATYQPVPGSPVPVGNFPEAISLTPDGQQAWIANSGDNTVTVLDTATYQPVQPSPVPVGSGAGSITLTPDGQQVWVGNNNDGTVTVLDTATHQSVPGSPLPAGNESIDLAFVPNGSQVWVVNMYGNTVTVLAITAYEPVPTS